MSMPEPARSSEPGAAPACPPGAPPGITRRQALAELSLGAVGLALAGCGMRAASGAARDGSTLRSTYVDASGDGALGPGAGAPLIDRTELAPRADSGAVLATLAHLSDVHVLDAQSPARVPFLRRLGAPFNSTFRPQEALTAHVLDGAVRSIDALSPDAVIQGGDLIDNAQGNELELALLLLRGARVVPGSGGDGYTGVQSAANPDPFYYRPDLDAPRHTGLLDAATRPFAGIGLGSPWYPVLGDHDLLVQGVLAPGPLTRAIALGSRAVWDLPVGLQLARGDLGAGALAPDGLGDPAASAVTVSPDPARRQLDAPEVLARLRAGSGHGGAGGLMNYSFDVGARLRVIVLDLVRRAGGSGGVLHAGQERWLAAELARAGRRWVLVVSHQPLTSTAGGERLLALLDRDRRVLAALCGHTHRNQILPRPTPGGGYWLISTCSLIDHPQEVRALRVSETREGVVLETWMLDHAPDGAIGDTSRSLAYLDAQGGRPQGFAGSARDRNARLYKR